FICVNEDDDIGSNYFISSSLKRGAKENTNSKGNSNIITVVMNAIENLCFLVEFFEEQKNAKKYE
ncbi:3437_t:CDS:1, partial [Dentiscutata erythropus]